MAKLLNNLSKLEVESLNAKYLLEKMNQLKLSETNSKTAKNGYKEEELVCNDLNKNEIKELLNPLLGNYNEFIRIKGNHKCDIQSNNNDRCINLQVKKYKQGQFQQLDRHWVSDFTEKIPKLNDISQTLKDLVEYPLLENKTHIDKSKLIKKLSNTNYSQETLDNFLESLNNSKKQILEYAFFGINMELKPEYLIGVEYKNKIRTKLIIFKIVEIIDYLEKLSFKISPRKTVILLGDEGTISLQRKGGDSWRKSSNQLQIKIILSNLIDKVSNIQYNITKL